MSVTRESDEACLACLDRFMDAVNAHDVSAMEQEMHFPHVRIAAGTITTYPAPGSNPLDLFSRLQLDDGWHRSQWISKAIVQGDDKKVHVAVHYTRMRRDGSIIGNYHSLYILTRQDGRWGVLARSSFGP